MVNMVPHEAFACSCVDGDVVLRQSYKPESCASETFWMWIFLWKETRLRQLMSSPGAPSAGPSTHPSYSSGPSIPPSYSSGPSTPPNYSSGSSRNAECSNCKHLRVHRVQDEKRVWFEVELQGVQGDREAEVFQVSNDDTAVVQRRFLVWRSSEIGVARF
nr:hypothetical protein [Tanacetum cinerariifolium]